jgi:hydroxymethylpyrimidine/phosphomethylpyrimidine kinase
MRIALSIAGSDPTGGAGLQADLQVFRAFGVHGAGVVTALTTQDTAKVHQVLPAFPNVVLEQIRVLVRDVQPDAVKIGMLASDDVARAVQHGLETLAQRAPGVPRVVDPVLAASDGSPLLERRAVPTLLALCEGALLTPNLEEASQLAGCDVSTRQGVERAARTLIAEAGAGAVLVKGGHAEGAPDDCLALGERAGGVAIRWLAGTRLAGGPVHGTGCALASAAAAGLALGQDLPEAVEAARAFVVRAIAGAEPAGAGARLLAPASAR